MNRTIINKWMTVAVISCLAILAGTTGQTAEDPFKKGEQPKQPAPTASPANADVLVEMAGLTDQLQPINLVSVEIRLIEMPRPAADEVFKEQGGIAKTYTVSEKTLSAINQMVRDNKAKVVSQSKVVTKSGMPAQSIAVNQFSYPANFELHAEETIKAGEDSGQVRYVISPTEIDERECGTIFELEPTIRSDGKTIDWKMNPQRVRISSQPWKMSAQATGKQELEIPRFITEAVTSQIITKDGDTVLMSVCDSTDNMEKKDKPCDNVILWLVTAWIIPVK